MSSAPTAEGVLSARYVLGAIALHVLLVGVFGLAMVSLAREAPPAQLAIQATLVDASSLKPPRPRVDTRKQEQERKAQERRKEEEQQKLREQEQEREKEKLREQEQQRVEEQKREQERLAEQQKVEQQKIEQQKAEQQKAEQERREREVKAEAERKRVAEIERKQKEREAGERRQTEEREQQVRESELKRQLEEEEGQNAVAQSGVLDRYRAMIQQHIYRAWNRPASARPGIECEISVTQSPRGDVLSAKIGTCNGDAVVRQSIENALLRASPLPLPEDSRAFQRNLVLQFKPKD